MSTQFRPLEIPPGVVAKSTKQMSSTNWSEVNLMRWVEGQMGPVGGRRDSAHQQRGLRLRLRLPLPSDPRLVRPHRGLPYRLLVRGHLYVDIGGVLIEITPCCGRRLASRL